MCLTIDKKKTYEKIEPDLSKYHLLRAFTTLSCC